MSKMFQLSAYDWKSIGLYVLTIFAVGLLANLTGLQEILNQYIDPQFTGLIISVIGIALKKFLQDYSK